MAMARATEGLGKKQEAQSLFVRAFEFGAVDWQKRESQRNVANIVIAMQQQIHRPIPSNIVEYLLIIGVLLAETPA